MSTPNFYPRLPEIPYERTIVDMNLIIAHAKTLTEYSTEVKRMAYCMFRNESANGTKGVNNNYAGIQADCGLWSGMKNAVATSVRIDSGKKLRRFICFAPETGYKDTFEFLCFKVLQRKMYIGAPDVSDIKGLVRIYLEKWVGRKSNPTAYELQNWSSLYESAKKHIQ